MRGSSLASPVVIEALRPFIVCNWTGRSRDKEPAEVRTVMDQARAQMGRFGNLLLCVLDSQGRFVRAFSPFPGGSNPTGLGFQSERMGQFLKDQLDRATAGMELPRAVPAKKTLTLPDVTGAGKPNGVRVYLSFSANKINHFRVPVVEAVPLSAAQWQPLSYPASPGTLDAKVFHPWLEQIYPPAVMDGLGGFRSITGTLTFQPAGADKEFRYALVRGPVAFVLDNEFALRYQGQLELVLKYRQDSPDVVMLRGALTAKVPRQEFKGPRTVEYVTMTAAIESRPE